MDYINYNLTQDKHIWNIMIHQHSVNDTIRTKSIALIKIKNQCICTSNTILLKKVLSLLSMYYDVTLKDNPNIGATFNSNDNNNNNNNKLIGNCKKKGDITMIDFYTEMKKYQIEQNFMEYVLYKIFTKSALCGGSLKLFQSNMQHFVDYEMQLLKEKRKLSHNM